MNDRAENLRKMIASKEQLIQQGVGAEREAELQTEVDGLKEELNGLQEAQELPPQEEVKAELILTTVDGLPLEVYTRNEDAAILIRCEVESIVERLNKAHEAVVGVLNNKLHTANELELALRQRNTELERDYKLISDEHDELVVEKYELGEDNQQLTLERDEALKYRDNAVKQLEDMAFELEQNRIELNRNREVRALTEAERTAEQEAARQRFMDSRIKIYNPRNADELNSRERIANLAETGEEIRYLAIYEKGGYNIITEDEALAIQAMNKPIDPIEIPEVDSQEIFQGEDAGLPETEQGDQQTDSGSDEPSVGEDAEEDKYMMLKKEVMDMQLIVGALELHEDGSVTWNRNDSKLVNKIAS